MDMMLPGSRTSPSCWRIFVSGVIRMLVLPEYLVIMFQPMPIWKPTTLARLSLAIARCPSSWTTMAISSIGMRLREYSSMIKFVSSSAVVRGPQGIFSRLGALNGKLSVLGRVVDGHDTFELARFWGLRDFFAVFSGGVVDVVISDFFRVTAGEACVILPVGLSEWITGSDSFGSDGFGQVQRCCQFFVSG